MNQALRRRPDLIRLRPLWFLISLVALVVAVGSMVRNGSRAVQDAAAQGRQASFVERIGLNAGIDFTGGAVFRFRLAEPFSAGEEAARQDEFRQIITGAGLERFKIQTVGTGNQRSYLNVQTAALTDEDLQRDQGRLTTALTERFPGLTLEEATLIGPLVSAEILTSAAVALTLGIFLILLYIAIRYDFMFGVCAILALFHDALIMVGWASLARLEVDGAFVAALLAVIGYSVNDTIIIFDRIRENVRRMAGRPFPEIANYSLWETMARSINTLLTVLFVLFALLFFGGVTLKPFVSAMTVGMISGGYSSIFFAAQILAGWKVRREAKVRPRAAGGAAPPPPSAPPPTRPRPSPEPPPPVDRERLLEELTTPPPLPSGPSEEIAAARRERRKQRKAPKMGKRKRRH